MGSGEDGDEGVGEVGIDGVVCDGDGDGGMDLCDVGEREYGCG